MRSRGGVVPAQECARGAQRTSNADRKKKSNSVLSFQKYAIPANAMRSTSFASSSPVCIYPPKRTNKDKKYRVYTSELGETAHNH